MIEIIDMNRMFLYVRVPSGGHAYGINCRWAFKKKINSFPISFTRQINPKAIFSPSLKRHLAYDPINQAFLFRNLMDETQDIVIPKGIISREKNKHLNKSEEEFESEFLKRFMFLSET